jgi:hypothetical protein
MIRLFGSIGAAVICAVLLGAVIGFCIWVRGIVALISLLGPYDEESSYIDDEEL